MAKWDYTLRYYDQHFWDKYHKCIDGKEHFYDGMEYIARTEDGKASSILCPAVNDKSFRPGNYRLMI